MGIEYEADMEEDEYGHIWGIGWIDSDKSHPGFGGSIDIYGGYISQCEKCGLYIDEFDKQINKQKCGDK